jgi:hypothetical protein
VADSGTVSDRGIASVTVIRLARPWHVGLARRRWKRLYRELSGLAGPVESRCVASWREREVVIITMAPDEDVLRRLAGTAAHVSAVRWTIARRRAIWSGMFTLSGWSSMSGPHGGPHDGRGT